MENKMIKKIFQLITFNNVNKNSVMSCVCSYCINTNLTYLIKKVLIITGQKKPQGHEAQGVKHIKPRGFKYFLFCNSIIIYNN